MQKFYVTICFKLLQCKNGRANAQIPIYAHVLKTPVRGQKERIDFLPGMIGCAENF